MSRRVLVTGAAGVMGARLVRGLLDRGFAVRCLVLPNDRGGEQLQALGAEVCRGDVTEPASLGGLCRDVHTVYHLAAVILSNDTSVFRRVNRDGTANLLRAAVSARAEHFIYVSSASVTYPRRTPYARSKFEAEELVRDETRIAHTIVRPTLVYDEHGGQELALFRAYLQKYPLVPFIGPGLARKRPVFSGDVIDGLVALADRASVRGKLYNLSGGESITIADLARLILKHSGQSKPFVHLPVPLCQALALLAALSQRRPTLTLSAIAGLVEDADLDPSEAMRDFGYHPLGVREGFARCFPLAARHQ